MMQALIFISALIMILYAAFILYTALHLPSVKQMTTVPDIEGVSVIIPCRNEGQHILACLESIAGTVPVHFPFEVLLIDDHSEDDPFRQVSSLSAQLPLRMLRSAGEGKKAALLTGISNARFDTILTLDADSVVGKRWLQAMAAEYASRKLLMLCGPVSLAPTGDLFTALQRAESAAVVGISAVMLESGRPATCNGANLMFSRQAFEALGAYSEHLHLASGDDDLLMHRFFLHHPSATGYTLDREALVTAAAAHSRREFFAQRIRWISKRKAYLYPWNGYLHALVLTQLAAFYFLLLSAFLFYIPYALLFVLLKYGADMVYRRKLERLISVSPLHIVLLPFFQLYIFALLFRTGNNTPYWKGRKLL